ncbi:hypothetical protein VTO42DRAFT_1956 [Malbranchea cinnamomea]
MSIRAAPRGLYSLTSRLSTLFISSSPSATAAAAASSSFTISASLSSSSAILVSPIAVTRSTRTQLQQRQQPHYPPQQIRSLHKTARPKPVPPPTPFVPDTKTLLTLIGRGMVRYAPKLESWEELFRMSSEQLRDDVGITSARERRYLLRWLERFRQGRYGIGGDLDHVVDGVAELKVVPVPVEKHPGGGGGGGRARRLGTATLPPGMRYAIVNTPPGTDVASLDVSKLEIKKYMGFKLHHGYMIRAPYIELTKASEGLGVHGMQARLVVREGMWEDKLGRKIDGGERRRAEIRSKRRAEERKAKREAAAAAEAAANAQ